MNGVILWPNLKKKKKLFTNISSCLVLVKTSRHLVSLALELELVIKTLTYSTTLYHTEINQIILSSAFFLVVVFKFMVKKK